MITRTLGAVKREIGHHPGKKGLSISVTRLGGGDRRQRVFFLTLFLLTFFFDGYIMKMSTVSINNIFRRKYEKN